jgi:hypothetical protein
MTTGLLLLCIAALVARMAVVSRRRKQLENGICDVVNDFGMAAKSRLVAAIPGIRIEGGPRKCLLPGRTVMLRLELEIQGTHCANFWIFWDFGKPRVEIEAWDKGRHALLVQPPYALTEVSTALDRLEECLGTIAALPIV